MENNITYNFDAFEEASDIMRQCVVNLSEKNARQQIAAMAMQGLLASPGSYSVQCKDPEYIAKLAVECADALIAELNKEKADV